MVGGRLHVAEAFLARRRSGGEERACGVSCPGATSLCGCEVEWDVSVRRRGGEEGWAACGVVVGWRRKGRKGKEGGGRSA